MKNRMNVMTALLLVSGLFATQVASAKVCKGMGSLIEGKKKTSVLVYAILDSGRNDLQILLKKNAKNTTLLLGEEKAVSILASSPKTRIGSKAAGFEYAFDTYTSIVEVTYPSFSVQLNIGGQVNAFSTKTTTRESYAEAGNDGPVSSDGAQINLAISNKARIQATEMKCE